MAEPDWKIDALPDGWTLSTVGETADILDRLRVPLNSGERRQRQGPYPYWGANGVLDHIDDYIFDEPLVLMAEDGGYFDEAATRPICQRLDGPAWVNNHAHIIRPTGADRDYFYYWFAHRDITPFIKGGTRSKLNQADLKLLPIWLPPMDEQQRIAEVLRSVDQAIENADLVLAKAKMVRQLAINELLSARVRDTKTARLSCRLSEIISIAHGFPFKSQYFTSNRDDPILLTPGNFSVEKTLYFGDRTKHYSGPVPGGYMLENGSLVVVMTDLTQDMAILGNAVEISGNGIVLHNQRIGRVSILRPDIVTKGYVRLLLNSGVVQSRIKSTASGSTVRHTAPSRILECEVLLPPLEDQARIVAIAKSLDEIVTAEERRRSDDEVTGPLSHLRGVKQMIAADLLSGKLRVLA